MKPIEVAGLIKKQNAELFADLPDRKIMQMMRVMFAQLGRQLDDLKAGESVRVPGFGSFRMRQAEREKDGQKVTITRVAFKRAREREEAESRQRRNPRRKAEQ